MSAPSYEEMVKGRRDTHWRDFVRGLKPGVVDMVDVKGRNLASLRSMIRTNAQIQGFKVITRVVGDTLYVVRVIEEQD